MCIFKSNVFGRNMEKRKQMGRAMQKVPLNTRKNVLIHFILHMRKVSSGPLLSIEIFCGIQSFSLRTANTLIRLSAYAGRHVLLMDGKIMLSLQPG